MENQQGLLEDKDITQNMGTDQESQNDLHTEERRKAPKEDSSSEEADLGLSDRGYEHCSPPKHLGHPRDLQDDSGAGPSFSPTGRECKTLYSRLGGNPIESIRNPKKRKASQEVFAVFSCSPKKRDPTHV